MHTTADLNSKLYKLLPNIFQGALPLDYIVQSRGIRVPTTGESRQSCFIVNTDPSYLPGEHWIGICFPPASRDKVIFIDSQALRFYQFNRLLARFLEENKRSVVESMPFGIQGRSLNCGIFCAFILCHLQEFDFNLHRLVGDIFSDTDFYLNNIIVQEWWRSAGL